MRRILLASDFSKASRRALTEALRLAKRNRATLTITHVITPVIPATPDQYIAFDELERVQAQARTWAQRELGKLTAAARKAGVRAAGVLAEGNATREIVRMAKRRRADLVIVGTHGRTGLAKLFLGSVAAGVVAATRCPVMTVRGA